MLLETISPIGPDLAIPDRCISGPLCACGKACNLTDGHALYPYKPEAAQKPFWQCPCGSALVGCHPGTITPLGTPADKDTRRARMAAHDAFDPLWKSKTLRRTEAYKRLASKLNIRAEDCHIGLFDIATCLRVQMLVMTGELLKKS